MSPGGGLRELLRSPYAWSLVEQGFSSATTLLFTLIAARNLGPSGLGTLAVGYAALVVAVGFQRVLVVDALITRIGTSARTARAALAAALTTTVVTGLFLTGLALAVSALATGSGARGLLIFAPWVVPVLVHSLLKAWLYREGRAVLATVTSGTWLTVMLVATALGLSSSDWEITAAWGIGACGAVLVSTLAAFEMIGVAGRRATLTWIRDEVLTIGHWRAAGSAAFGAADYARAAGIAAILSPAALGGYRAIETLFAPTTLVSPAFVSAGLPPLRAAIEDKALRAWALALRISALSAVLVIAYVLLAVMLKDELIGLFGDEFAQYDDLILPIAFAQLVTAAGLGFALLVIAARRVREIAVYTTLHAVTMVALALPLAALYGLEAAAWGVALAGVLPNLLTILLARRITHAIPHPAHAEPR